jgi:CheY-specific phosphatase CheX
MNDGPNYLELSRRYGFAAKLESASRLTQLVSRQDADLDEIAKVIDKDPALRARLLRVANPEAENEAEYSVETVEDALMRNGMGCVLVLAMSTPLAQALIKTFQTMLSLKIETVDPRTASPLAGEQLVCNIDFTGKVVGHVLLRMSAEAGRLIAAGILGLPPKEMQDMNEVRDVAGELLNIMTGNFKSNLCDAGLECKLSPPDVRSMADFLPSAARAGSVEHMAFHHGNIQIFVDVTANPWSDD